MKVKRLVIFAMIAVLFTAAFVSQSLAQSTVYNAIPSTLAPSYPSLGFQATSTSEFGDYVHLSGTDRKLDMVSVRMVNWAYQSEAANLAFCSTNPGLCPGGGFLHTFTINIYGVVAGSPLNIKGPLLATWTQQKLVPWRPAPDLTCPGGTAWRAGDGSCYNGFAFDLNFTLSSLSVTLPNDIIVSIAYNTQSYGSPAIGAPGPYNSLNVGAIAGPASVGSDANADRIFASSTWTGFYTDGGAGGLGIFREDTSWGPQNGTVPFRITATPVAAPAPEIINAGFSSPFVNPNAWLIYNDESDTIDNSLGSLVVGPGAPPLGNGSAQISVTGSQRRNLATYQFSGTVLSDINTLKFSTFNPSAGNGGGSTRSGYLQFNVDFNGTDTWQSRIGFVPSQNGTVIQDQWQEWDAINGGTAMWFYSGATWPGTATPGTTLRSWSDILASYPGVRIRVTDSFFGVRVGEPYSSGYTENIDAIKFGTSSSLKYFNFDPLPTVTYVNGTWAGTAVGADPDGAGPATSFGYDAFDTIQGGINGVSVGGAVYVASGNYTEDVNVNKANVSVHGAGIDVSYIIGPYNSGTANTLLMNASGALVEGFTITRNGNDVANWAANLKSQGVNMSSPGTNMTLQYCKITGNRNGIYVGQTSNGNTIRRNIIDFNRTGVHLVDHSGDLIEENFITNNWTMGILYRTEGGPPPTGMTVRNNKITGNWYSEVEFREPSTGSSLNMSGNYFGPTITRSVVVSGEPGYTSQIPVEYGGGSVAPGSHPTIAGPESARIDYSPYLNNGTDTDLGTTGFQGDFSNISVTPDAAQVGSTSRIDEAIGLTSAGGTINVLAGTYSGNVTINKAVNLHGAFTISGSFSTTAVGASISPGNSPGIINSGNLSLGPGSTTNMEINGTTVGTQYDQLNVTGTVNISTSAALNLSFGFVPAVGNTFILINNDGADAVTGNFNGLPEGTVFYVGASALRISYVGGTGNDVTLTVIAPCNSVSISSTITTLTGNTNVQVPVNVDNVTGNGLYSTDFTLTYNPAVVTSPVVTIGNVTNTGAQILSVNTGSPGVITVSIFSSTPFSGTGQLVNIQFTATPGAPGTSTPINFSSFKFNEGTACISTSNGLVSVISGTITGTVRYGTVVPAAPPSVLVPNVLMSAVGSINTSATTNGSGIYSLSGMGSGSYTVTPSKTGGATGLTVSGSDAACIAQYVVGLNGCMFPTATAAQLAVADVSGAGGITSFDAALIARFAAGLPNHGAAGTWYFAPANIVYPNVNTNISGQDYLAYLMGDVTGNYNPANPFSALIADGQKPMRISAPTMTAGAGTVVSVPVSVQDTTGKRILSYQFDLRYDPTVLEPAANTVDLAGTISEGYAATVNPIEPGLLKVVVYGVNDLAGAGEMLKLNFNVIGAVDSASDIIWDDFVLNEGGINIEPVNGRVQVTAASTNASISGRVLTSIGQGVANARVTLTDTTGRARSVATNGFGNFAFAELQVGQTYTISVASKRYTFAPQTVSVTGDAVSVDLIALP